MRGPNRAGFIAGLFFYEWKGTDRDILKNKKGENRKGLLNGSVDNSGITQMV